MEIDANPRAYSSDLERRLLRQVMLHVGNPRVSLRLWDGDEFSVSDGNPVACIEFCQRRALYELIAEVAHATVERYAQQCGHQVCDPYGEFDQETDDVNDDEFRVATLQHDTKVGALHFAG